MMKTTLAILIALSGLFAISQVLQPTKPRHVTRTIQDESQADPLASQHDPSERLSGIMVSATQLANDYANNEVYGDSIYRGKRIVVYGYVTSIEKDVFDKPYLTMESPYLTPVMAHINPQYLTNAANLKRGQTVTLNCIGAGYLVQSPMLDDCRFN